MKKFQPPPSHKPLTKTRPTTWMATIAAGLALAVGSGHALAQRPVGVDVSSFQGSPNWSSAKSCGISFAIAKATEGATVNDPDFTFNMSNGKAAGVLMGTYHFAHPELNSPGTESSHFWSIAGGYIKNDGKSLMPVLDFEVFSGVVGASSYSAWANSFNDSIGNDAGATGITVRPVLYTSSCSACDFGSSVAQWIPWMANYNGESAQTGTPWSSCSSCNVWGDWDVWQYTDAASVCGISGGCDGDVFNGTLADLKATLLIGGGGNGGGGNPQFSACVGPIVANSDGRLEMFGVGSNTHMWHNYQGSPNSGWNGWIDMANANSIAGPTVARDKDGRLEVFVECGSGNVFHNYQTIGGGGAWNGWASQGGPSVTNLIALTNLDGRIEVFGIGSNGDVWHEWQTAANGAWTTSWGDMTGLHPKAGMVGIANADGRLELFAVGPNGNVWHNYQTTPGQGFNGWIDWGSSSAGLDPKLAVARNASGTVEVFGVDSTGNVHHNYQTSPNGAWNGFIGFGGISGVKPGFVVGMNHDGRLEMFGVGSNNDVWHVWQDEPGSRWHAWSDLGGSGQNAQLVVGNNANGEMQLFGIGNNNHDVWSIYQSSPGGSWGNWFDLGGNGTMFYFGQP